MSRSTPATATATVTTKPNRPDPVAHLVALLADERAHATRAWTILSELRLHGVLPDWARQALNDALAAAVPGFREALQSALGIPRLTHAGD